MNYGDGLIPLDRWFAVVEGRLHRFDGDGPVNQPWVSAGVGTRFGDGIHAHIDTVDGVNLKPVCQVGFAKSYNADLGVVGKRCATPTFCLTI